MASIKAVAASINELAQSHEFGTFQSLRSRLKGLASVRSVVFNINNKSVNEEKGFAYHTGGREELQFNIGFEQPVKRFRYGVAFSLEKSPSFTSIDPLLPKIERFNEFVRLNPQALENYRMWISRRDQIIKQDTAVREITDDEIDVPNFIFMGKQCPVENANAAEVLDCFEDLLELYRFVESPPDDGQIPSQPFVGDPPFLFQERLSIGEMITSTELTKRNITVVHRSNQIKRLLCKRLMGSNTGRLGDEIPSGNGGKIDLVCFLPSGEYDFYEIKPATYARHAIREALPQLLEYAYRSGGHHARRLIIASQAKLDPVSASYLEALRKKGLPIHYEHVPLG